MTARQDLRRHARSVIQLPVTISDTANRVQGHIEFDTHDLSVGGAFLRSDLLFEVGEELTLAFTLPAGHAVRARGRVVRVARDTGDEGLVGMGVQFAHLTERDRDAIVELVARGGHG
jgi:Tfp pilus assembly protein PilZ